MGAEFEDAGIDSVQDYTRVWVEQIDRGGLCHIRDEVMTLFQETELVCRQFLDIRTVPKDHIMPRIEEVTLTSQNILKSWQD